MSSRFHLALVVLALVLITAGTALAERGGRAVQGRYVVVYQPARGGDSGADTTRRLERAYGFAAFREYRHAVRGFAARLTGGQAAGLRKDPRVAAVTPDRVLHASGTVSLQPGEEVPTGVRRIGAVQGGAHGSGAAVAVLDTGIDTQHEDLDVRPGTNCTGDEPPDDDNGHGTFVAGVIGAGNTGSGIVGIAPGTPLYAVKTLDSEGVGFISEVICGIDWVTANTAALGIKVANLSLGGPGPRSTCDADALHLAICNSAAAGVTYTVAAGNDGRDADGSDVEVPASYPEVLTVTAASDGDGLPGRLLEPSCVDGEGDDVYASFSNFATLPADAEHFIAAPGVCITSTAPGGQTAVGTGTSAAAPHVAGVVSLCAGEIGVPDPCADMTSGEVIQQIRADAAARADGSNGFIGDPAHPVGAYFGYLVSAVDPSVRRITPPAPAPAPPPGPADDAVSLRRVHAGRVQRLRRLRVTVSLEEAGSAVASAVVRRAGSARSRVFRLRSKSRQLHPARAVTLLLDRPAREVRAIRRALRRGASLKAQIRVTLADAGGNTLLKRRSVRLRR